MKSKPTESTSGPLMLDEADADERALPLFLATLFGLFGGVALALSATGLHSVVSYSVSRHTQELGIRIALGARRADVLRLVLAGTVRLICVGLVIGAAASVVTMRAIAPLLQDWNAREPLPYLVVILILLATGLLAAWIPAARAARIKNQSRLCGMNEQDRRKRLSHTTSARNNRGRYRRFEIDPPIGHRETLEVIPRSDLIAARIELFAGFGIEGIQRRMRQ